MLHPPFQNALVLTGPTGSGKTELALGLAERLDAEIISMDSMAVYRRLDIGTAKPSLAERARVRHHLVDVLEPWESASVAWWLQNAEACCREVESRGKQVLFVGGTPLYLKALLMGLFEGPPLDVDLRRRLEEMSRTLGSAALHERLVQVDPASAARLHPNDRRRIVRALEVYEQTGQPLSSLQTQWNPRVDSPAAGLCPAVLCLDLPRTVLYDRINRRVEAMFAAGLVEEVRALRLMERPMSREAAQALGYREVFAHLEGRAGLEETITLVQTRSRNFAKRQLTWFRHLPGSTAATSELTASLWEPKMKRS